MLWEVAYADGEVHVYQASLLRRVTGLLYVTGRESGKAPKPVLARVGLQQRPAPPSPPTSPHREESIAV